MSSQEGAQPCRLEGGGGEDFGRSHIQNVPPQNPMQQNASKSHTVLAGAPAIALRSLQRPSLRPMCRYGCSKAGAPHYPLPQSPQQKQFNNDWLSTRLSAKAITTMKSKKCPGITCNSLPEWPEKQWRQHRPYKDLMCPMLLGHILTLFHTSLSLRCNHVTWHCTHVSGVGPRCRSTSP